MTLYAWLVRDRPVPWVPGGPDAAAEYRRGHDGLNPDEDRLVVYGSTDQIRRLHASLNAKRLGAHIEVSP